MLNALTDSLSDLASSEDEEDGEDKEDEQDKELDKLSKDDEPGWVMGTISKMIHHRMESLRQKQIRLDELMQWGWGDTADYFWERDMKYGTAESIVLSVVKTETDKTTATPLPTTFGELMQTLNIVPAQLQMPQRTSPPGSSHMRLGSEKSPSHTNIAYLLPDAVANSLTIENVKAVEQVNFDPRISRPELIII